MTASGGRLRVPPAVMRLGMRQIGARCLDPALPWPVQRTRLERFLKTSLLPRGTMVTEQTIGGGAAQGAAGPRVAGQRAAGTDAGPPKTVVHFHGGGYCVGSASLGRAWAAHLSARTGCSVVLPEYRLGAGDPHPAAPPDAGAGLT